MTSNVEWVIVKRFGQEIGAVGFVEERVAVVTAFYEDRDANKDGKVSKLEWLGAKVFPVSLNNMNLVEVAMQARGDPDIAIRDPSFSAMASKMFVNFARGLVVDGIYAVYFSRAVSSLAGPIAGRASDNLVVQFALRKGMEHLVKQSFKGALAISEDRRASSPR